MLISNLVNEERRGTLNLSDISLQSTLGVLGGKLLGVPILLYLAAIIAVLSSVVGIFCPNSFG
jgi:hypothetical protein